MSFFGKRSLRSTSARIERKKDMPWKIMAVAAIVALPLAGSIMLAHLARFRVTTIMLSGNVVVSDSDIRDYVNKKLAGSYFFVFPHNTVAIYPRAGIEHGLSKNFPRFSSVEVSTVNAKTIAVKVAERKPAYVWCPSLQDSHCYFLDNTGYIFADAPYFSGHVYFIFYGPIANPDTPLGNHYMPADQFAAAAAAIAALEKIGMVPLALEVLPSDSSAVPDYRIDLSGGGTLTFRSSDAGRIREIVLSVLSSSIFAAMPPAKLGTAIDYIDARYGDKVVYKMKDASVPPDKHLYRVAASSTPETLPKNH